MIKLRREDLTDYERKANVFWGKINLRNRNSNYIIRDYYREYTKVKRTKDYIDRKVFTALIRDYALEVIKQLIYNKYVLKMPYALGKLYIVEYKKNTSQYFNDKGEIKYLPVDWGKTRRLWNKDPEAKKNKKTMKMNIFSEEFQKAYRIEWQKTGYYIGKYNDFVFSPRRGLLKEVKAIAEEKNITFLRQRK